MRAVATELAAAPAPEPSEDFWRRQRQSIMRRVRTSPEPVVSHWPAWRAAGVLATLALAVLVVRPRFGPPSVPSSVERLDDDALLHLHDLLPALTPASTIDDADSDLLSIHDLGDDELDRLAELLGNDS